MTDHAYREFLRRKAEHALSVRPDGGERELAAGVLLLLAELDEVKRGRGPVDQPEGPVQDPLEESPWCPMRTFVDLLPSTLYVAAYILLSSVLGGKALAVSLIVTSPYWLFLGVATSTSLLEESE